MKLKIISMQNEQSGTMKKILAITTIRSDYDLMSGLYRLLHNDPEVDLQLLVAGAHLSPTLGHTVDVIKRDGFRIFLEIESLIHADTPKSRLKSASILLQNAIDSVAAWKPDLILYAGDREDVLVGGMLGTFLAIPTIHFFGGDHEKDGHADTVIRHATSKLSTFHIVSIEQHRQRLLRMGEASERIFVAGSIALDKFTAHLGTAPPAPETLDKKWQNAAMVIYHPIGGEEHDAGQVMETILLTLKKHGIPAMVSYPNSDPGNHLIIEKIRQYQNDPDFWFYTNLERAQFLQLYRHAAFLIGNSSSGIMEAASIPMAAINVGLRQKGRYCGDNVVFCDNDAASIERAILQVQSAPFQAALTHVRNPYGDGHSCQHAYKLIKTTDFSRLLNKTEDPLELTP